MAHMYASPSRYRDTEVLSSSPEQLVPLLYERLLVSLRRGVKQMRAGDTEGRYESLSRASDIVCELLSSLDFEKGGDIAPRLASLYAFWAREISESSRTLQSSRLERVEQMVASLHEAWKEAARTAGARPAVGVHL